MENYAIFSTTADVGISVRGKGLEEFYGNAIKGLNLLIFGKDYEFRGADQENIHPFVFEGDSAENVLINLLSEVIFLLYMKNIVTFDIKIKKIKQNLLEADLVTLSSSIEPEVEIKSVTYHNLKIVEKNGMISADIVFDV